MMTIIPPSRPTLTVFAALLSAMLLAGCQTATPSATLPDAEAAYERGDYEQAYRFAARIADDEPSLDRDEAAYIAGLAAGQMGDRESAIRYLSQAVDAYDSDLAADAGVMLGLAYAGQERYAPASDALLEAAPHLEGEDQARAYFYAGMAQQKLGRWASARDNLVLARSLAQDPDFRAEIQELIKVNGYTIELGSFDDVQTAESAAEEIAQRAQEVGVAAPRLLPDPSRPGQTLVHLGRFSTYDSARSYRQRLGVPDAFIVPITSPSDR